MSWRWNLFDETRHMETHLDERIEGLRARGQSLRYQAYAAGLLLFLLLLAWGWERVEPMRILAPGLWGGHPAQHAGGPAVAAVAWAAAGAPAQAGFHLPLGGQFDHRR